MTSWRRPKPMFRSNAAFSDFIRVMPDGKTPDAKYHTAEEGGTIISRNADHVGTLSAGEHISVLY
ncbi:MAG: hypothetical protein KH365_06655 [Clostridiales bacterium]|nr:hypothetical protein [Clostridiales bacterium]